MHNHATAVTNG